MATTEDTTVKVSLAMPKALVDHLKRTARAESVRDDAEIRWTDLVRRTLGKEYMVMMELGGK